MFFSEKKFTYLCCYVPFYPKTIVFKLNSFAS